MQTLSLLLLTAMPAQQAAAPPPLPKAVLVGDSIRLGYAPLVVRKLDGVAVVSGPKANAGDSATLLKNLDDWGGPNTYPHYAAGWAVAGDTPFTWTKQIAGTYGGCRNPLVVHWPSRIKIFERGKPYFELTIDTFRAER